MFQKISNTFLAAVMVVALSACSGGQAPFDAESPSAAVSPAPASFAQAAPQQGGNVSGAITPANLPAVLQPQQAVSESERVAETLRLVDYEQSYSIEMNRLAQEQAEREHRAAISAQAGVVQGPGCEGTEGHAAVECERSLI